jgi:hypothetical protein
VEAGALALLAVVAVSTKSLKLHSEDLQRLMATSTRRRPEMRIAKPHAQEK